MNQYFYVIINSSPSLPSGFALLVGHSLGFDKCTMPLSTLVVSHRIGLTHTLKVPCASLTICLRDIFFNSSSPWLQIFKRNNETNSTNITKQRVISGTQKHPHDNLTEEKRVQKDFCVCVFVGAAWFSQSWSCYSEIFDSTRQPISLFLSQLDLSFCHVLERESSLKQIWEIKTTEKSVMKGTRKGSETKENDTK